jgi:hypothetical protein
MRWRIVIINSAVLLIVALLCFVTLRAELSEVLEDHGARKAEAERAVRAANVRLEVDGLRLERWLSERASEEGVKAVFSGGTAEARSQSARVAAQRLLDAASHVAEFSKLSIPLLVFVDSKGVAVGRNDSNQMRGDDLKRAYPSIGRALQTGEVGSHVWLNPQRSEQLLVSYAPVRGETNNVLGVIVAGSPLDDDRLAQISGETSGHALTLASVTDGAVEPVAGGGRAVTQGVWAALRSAPVLQRAATAMSAGLAVFDDGDNVFAAQPLRGYAGATLVLVAGLPGSLVPSVTGLLWPLLAVTLLGVSMTVAGAVFLGNYFAQPIAELEEGILAVINGRTNHRFEIEHAELGGLVFQLNSLLNVFMGVPETDEQGRTSHPPGDPYREPDEP